MTSEVKVQKHLGVLATNIVKLPGAAEEAAVLSHGMAAPREPSISVRRCRHRTGRIQFPCVNDARPAPRDAGLFFA
jgi:hypothetical protein